MQSGCGRWKGRFTTAALVCLAMGACSRRDRAGTAAREGRFASDVAFLQQHTTIVLLADPSREAQVVVAPGYQGRVMTSTTGGSDQPSFGWIGSSPALNLWPGQRYTHVHRTFHLVGPEPELDRIARAVLKVGLAAMKDAFGKMTIEGR